MVQVTKQTGPAGKPVNTLYIASKLDLVNEMYFAILLDRKSAGPMIIACGEGAWGAPCPDLGHADIPVCGAYTAKAWCCHNTTVQRSWAHQSVGHFFPMG